MKIINIVILSLIAGFIGCSNETEYTLIDQAKESAITAKCNIDSLSNKTLHIYTWSDYFSDDAVKSFEKALNVKVVIDTFDSNESMYAKLKAGASGYDIITPTSYQILAMAREGMIDKLDLSRLPNVVNGFDKKFVNQIIDPTFKYNVPYSVTYGGFCYLKDKIPVDMPIDTWNVLSNDKLKMRTSLLDDIRETLGGALMYLGYSINSTNEEELVKAAEVVIKWKNNSRKFDSESYKTEIPNSSSWLAHGYSADSMQIIIGDPDNGVASNDNVGFILPREGFSIAFDEFVISSKSSNKDLAYAFINYMYNADVAQNTMEFINGPVPVTKAISNLDPNYKKMIILDDEMMKKGQIILSFDDKPEVMEMYNKIWDKIKAKQD